MHHWPVSRYDIDWLNVSLNCAVKMSFLDNVYVAFVAHNCCFNLYLWHVKACNLISSLSQALSCGKHHILDFSPVKYRLCANCKAIIVRCYYLKYLFGVNLDLFVQMRLDNKVQHHRLVVEV